MALDIIEFLDPTGDIMIARVPQEGTGEFRLGAQLIVQESQVAVFFRDGQALDGFSAGRHTLETRNLPGLAKIIARPFGGKSPFRSYVYFLATKTFTNLGWGTPTPVLFRDTDLRMVTLRAHGAYSIRIIKPRTFLMQIVGTKGIETTFGLEEFFRQIIVAKFNQVVGQTLQSILDLPAKYNQIAAQIKQEVRTDFEQYGIQLVDLIVAAVTVPPEVQEMINRASGVAAQDTQKYKDIAAADALRSAASNPGSAGEGLGAGLGLGMGFGLAKQMADALNPQTSIPAVPDVRSRLKRLKELLDDGLIAQQEFDKRKEQILSEI
ncbi:MAG: SPFH domain-containing protein [Phycisphaeraceae bacterium]